MEFMERQAGETPDRKPDKPEEPPAEGGEDERKSSADL
jgi:hypothetical protein